MALNGTTIICTPTCSTIRITVRSFQCRQVKWLQLLAVGTFAIGGSAMWEMFMECEYPSTNDIIATPIGGAAIGEVLYRTSDMITDDRATGGERFGRGVRRFPCQSYARTHQNCYR